MARNADHGKTKAGQSRLFDVSDAQPLRWGCGEIPGRHVEQIGSSQHVGAGRGPSFPTRAGDGVCLQACGEGWTQWVCRGVETQEAHGQEAGFPNNSRS